ncbi:hypothetical protein [Tropicibacter naphthalenivorans]|uniref:hypothetical protein n=1 Tax=Tropicibacter naphthalenivorans TaxID=441103 RepID=UPI001180AA4C|nr:hypothetical protein [Tropicibacter naphthalenivorans]
MATIVLPLPTLAVAVGVAISGASSIYAMVASVNVDAELQAADRAGLPLLAKSVRISPPDDLPSFAQMRESLAAALIPATRDMERGFPMDRSTAIAQAHRQIMQAWGVDTPEALSRDETLDLYLLDQLLRATAPEAGRIAQMFHQPGVVLDIRAEVDRIAEHRALFDRDHAAFLSTQLLWGRTLRDHAPSSLLTALQALRVPDIDLWHRIVLEHDPRDPDQRAAALWCLRQRSCDRATVAAFLAFLAAEDGLRAAALRGDQVFLDTVQDIIEAWNAGKYRTQELALEPSDAIAQDAPRMTAALDELAQITGHRRWADPHGAFVDYTGRTPAQRAFWDIRAGRLIAAPNLGAFVDLPEHLPV